MKDLVIFKSTDQRAIDWSRELDARRLEASELLTALPAAAEKVIGPRADGGERHTVRYHSFGSSILVTGIVAEGSDREEAPKGTKIALGVIHGDRRTKIGKALDALYREHETKNIGHGARDVGIAMEFSVPGYLQRSKVVRDDEAGVVYQAATRFEGAEEAVQEIITASGIAWEPAKASEYYAALEAEEEA